MAGLFRGGGGSPAPKPPAPMPDEESPSVLQARRSEQERILSRAGRSSTILTRRDNRPSGGFDSYASRTLGSGG